MLVIAATDLRRRLRSRSAIISGIVGPLAMASVFGLLLGGTSDVTFTIGIADADGSPASRAVVTSLTASGGDGDGGTVRFRSVAVPAAEPAVDDGDLDAAIVLPAGLGAALGYERPPAAGSPALAVAVFGDPSRQVAAQVARAVADGVTAEANWRALVAAGLAKAGTPPAEASEPAASRGDVEVLELAPVAAGGEGPDIIAYYGAAMSILFLFFTVGFVARSLVGDRDEGVLGRILASPVRPGQLIAGRAFSVAVLGVASFVVVWLVTTLAFDAHWGPPGPVAAVVLATVLAVAGVGMLVASLGRTERQAESYTSLCAFVLALLGGNFVGPGVGPDLLRRIAMFTPNGQSLTAFVDLGADAAHPGAIARAIGILVAIGLVTGAIGVLRIHRAVTR
ncbi:hypothetical protein BCD49_15490 [Pseudofrankia sp. EUN1h]|nr:hypothetical protein BCD49_15490 [Pseudofrankia sp. EUN1h]